MVHLQATILICLAIVAIVTARPRYMDEKRQDPENGSLKILARIKQLSARRDCLLNFPGSNCGLENIPGQSEDLNHWKNESPGK